MDGTSSMDSTPDMTMTGDATGVPDGGNDVASDSSKADASPSDTGSTDASDGGSDPCKPPCLYKLLNGCLPEGNCMVEVARYCYANGVKQVPVLPPGQIDNSRYYKNGALCVTAQVGGTYVDPNGVVLGTLAISIDGSSVVTCTGESPVVIPATCISPAAGCQSGTCPPP